MLKIICASLIGNKLFYFINTRFVMATVEPSIVFVDRRSKQDRRMDRDPCKDIPVDLYHRMRRKSTDRRVAEKSLVEDYFDFLESHSKRAEQTKHDSPLN